MKIKRDFYLRPTLKVAKDLIGKDLVHRHHGKIYRAQIIETEAYDGFSDLACHGSRGMTERNQVMFRRGGYAYVYIIYGIHHCLNLVTGKEGYPSAVLIRALDYSKADGPAKLCREFKIIKQTHNGLDLTGNILWVEDRGIRPKICSGKRIGVDYAGECANWPWRFFCKKKSKRYWSDYITKHSNALDLEKGVFTWNNPKRIALSLKRSAEESKRRKGSPYQSAMSMLNFYINRAGKNLSADRKIIFEQVKVELPKVFGKR